MTQTIAISHPEIQPQHAPLLTQRDVSELTARRIDDPIRLFNLAGLGVNHEALLTFLRPTYESLDWDMYDVRRGQADIIRANYPNYTEKTHRKVIDYYLGALTLEDLSDILIDLDRDVIRQINSVQPYRRRSVAELLVQKDSRMRWVFERAPLKPVEQAVDSTDIRSLPRVYNECDLAITAHSEIISLVRGLAQMVENIQPSTKKLQMTMWHNSVVARKNKYASNAPEGVHQDGADYIVSALIIERTNVAGAESRIFGPDKKTEYLRYALQEGQGIFQADKGSSLWHDVTPMKPKDENQGHGIRSMLGFDINVIE